MPSYPLIDYESFFVDSGKLSKLRFLKSPIVSFFKLSEINRCYEDFCEIFYQGSSADSNFFQSVLRFFDVSYHVLDVDLAKIPKSGPLFVVSNHPFGAMDGIILGSLLSRTRPDIRLLANEHLKKIEPISPYIFGVDVFGGSDAKRKNLAAIKQTLSWLDSGGCVATFPSGTVSHFSFKTMRVVDPDWAAHVVQLIKRSGAHVLPLYFHGSNSWMFQSAGLVHPLLRTAMIGREMLRMQGSTVDVRIGKPISPQQLEDFDDNTEATRYLRLKSYVLSERKITEPQTSNIFKKFPLAVSEPKEMEPIVAPVEQKLLEHDINELPESAHLYEHGDLQVWVARANQIPNVLRELGRLREETFRVIGEGTGLSIDLDEFDPYYLHLFIWNKQSKEVVGAYRMGLTDEILNEFGKKGLYTSTLFRLKDELLEELNPSIELGRSFIRIEYQRKQATLSLLWKGIGTYVGRNPRYSNLFGGVSITDEYSSISKDLMIQFLKEHNFHPSFSRLVKAKNPHRLNKLRSLLHESMRGPTRSIEDVSALISEIEEDQKGIPILLKHYLKLNGVLLSFNKDPKFSDVVDGFILVDLLQADPQVLKRHMGKEAWEQFHAFHAKADSEVVV
jgi:putative hemolysin